MEKDLAILEIRNKTVTLMVANTLNDKVNVVYRTIRSLSTSLKEGRVRDLQSLTNDVKSLLVVEDRKHNVRYNINEVVLVLEPYGLEVYNSRRQTNVISTNDKVDRIDISNALSMLKKDKIPNQNNVIVDIIPNNFITDGNARWKEPPLGETSTQLTVDANIYSLPQAMVQDIIAAVDAAGVKIRRSIIAPVATSNLLGYLNPDLKTYILVDSGHRSSFLSFVGNNVVYSSKYFSFSYDDLIEEVSQKFFISKTEAEDLVKLYGYDPLESQLNPAICKSVNGEEKLNFYRTDLNEIITKYFRDWIDKFGNCLETLLSDYTQDVIHSLNLVFMGENFKINGFKDYLVQYLSGYTCIFPNVENVGLLDLNYLNCGAACYISSSYHGSLEDDIKTKFTEVKREERISNNKYPETEDIL